MFTCLASKLGKGLARYLSKPRRHYTTFDITDPDRLASVLQPGDVLLVDGVSRISTGIKYLTQSTWSHAAPVHHIRHHTLFAPRDFDISPYFRTIKPTQEAGFDHHLLTWAENMPDTGA
jgi:hypothetical protein